MAESTQLFLPTDASTDTEEGVFFIIIGKPGAGKSSLLGQIPKSLFYCCKRDRGAIRLRKRGLIPPERHIWAESFGSYSVFRKTLPNLRGVMQEHGLQTIVIEGLTGLVETMTQCAIDTVYSGNDSAFAAFGAGVKTLKNKKMYVKWFLSEVDKFNREGLNVVLSGHAVKDTTNDIASGESFKTIKPDCPPGLLNEIAGQASLVAYLVARPKFEKAKNKTTLAHGEEGTERVFICAEDAFCEAKNNHGVRAPIKMDGTPKENWKAVCDALGINRTTLRDV